MTATDIDAAHTLDPLGSQASFPCGRSGSTNRTARTTGLSSDFLSRWSQRKREVADADRTAAAGADAGPDAEAAGVSLEHAAPGDAPQAAVDAPITAEELAALPDPEDLTAASDMTAFLRKGVPASLRNRAMRRLWSLDPAIRDYVGDARDYAWDWNVPGGVPVSGPLSATTDVKQMVKDIFGREKAAPAEAEAAEQTVAADRSAPSESPPPMTSADAAQAGPNETVSAASGPQDSALPETPETMPETAAETAQQAPRNRPLRHGSALPI
ncbi:DUF3306 domain-containing protein [Aurantimonas sp. DM33-3]|uniref:DUF3306 domain-containing protein n=1 Tax=Aurantimonas sp. DM33-3 TaxID=2766955 RepID=UPI001FEEC551|nr:DUF3306 domain-containing protein [Aurantimonas sp. DM33-3]